jgi:hypothetical protein
MPTHLLTDILTAAFWWRVSLSYALQISIWMYPQDIQRIAIPSDDAFVAQSLIIRTHFEKRAGTTVG